jgi:GT2 family glycosyltransferase
VGLAAARNVATKTATSSFIAFLDNDTVVSPTWLRAALETADVFHADIVQCKLVLGTDFDRLDSIGYLLGPCGFPRHIVRPGAIDLPEYQQPRLLFGVKAAAMVIARQALEEAGGFDPIFFIYGEETDLCWRVLRSGGRVAFAPKSIVFHYSGGTVRFLPREADALLYRGGTRNYIHMVAKNSPPNRVVIDVAGQIAVWLGMAGLQTLRGRFKPAGLILLGISDGIVLLPGVFHARAESQLPYVDVPKDLRMHMSPAYAWRTLKEMTSRRS